MLHLLNRREIILARRHRGRLTDTMPWAECRQRGVLQLRPTGRQFFMDPHKVPLHLPKSSRIWEQ
jgi:hypothetical protein